jgi:hypothetical protein
MNMNKKNSKSKIANLLDMKKTMKANGKDKKANMKVLVNVERKMNMKTSIEANTKLNMG